MLSYQHIYHAGNFADVHKHAILVRTLKTLLLKPAKMGVLDTHAGRGLYDLTSDEAQKTGEYNMGVLPVLTTKNPPAEIAEYLALVRKYNAGMALTRYPGSAVLARDLLRTTDPLICIEKHPGEFHELQKTLGTATLTKLFQQDGFERLPDLVPLPERRGLVIIDPSYEIKSEYEVLPKALERAYKKWPQGVYLIWYPILESQNHLAMLERLQKTRLKDVLVSEITCTAPSMENYRMTGSGMIIVNPPWPAQTLAQTTKVVTDVLPLQTAGKVFWLNDKRFGSDF